MSNLITSLTTLLQSYLHWLSGIPGEVASVILLIAFVVLSALELNYPKRSLPLKKLRQSYQTNVSLFVFNSIVISSVSTIPLMLVAGYFSNQGLLSSIQNPAGKALLSFLSLDLLLYFWHRASHQLDGLWMFHKVHHNDAYLNVSTSFRIHFVELLILTIVKTAFIIVAGVDQIIILANESIFTLFIMFHHTNISFPFERHLAKCLIVPYLHRVHHSVERKEHDTNYGAVLSLWDRLFGSYAELEPIDIGIKSSSPQTFSGLIKFGFMPNPKTPANQPEPNLTAMIAEAAYYKAEKRAFTPGNELLDWLEAKTEIIKMVYGDKPDKKITNEMTTLRTGQPVCHS